MGILRRTGAAAAAAVTLAALPLVGSVAGPTAAAAGPMVATVGDSQSHEYELECVGAPGPCTTEYGRRLVFRISVSNFSGAPVTFGFQVENITSSAADWVLFPHQPPTTITTDDYGFAYFGLDLVDDGISEATETLRLRLTSANRPVTITDTGLGTLLDGNQLPPDCTATKLSANSGSLACSARPAGQRWQVRFECGGFPPPWARGNTVTGNGTSTATCLYDDPWLAGSVSFAVMP